MMSRHKLGDPSLEASLEESEIKTDFAMQVNRIAE